MLGVRFSLLTFAESKDLKHIPHRQWVFSIPRRLRICFMLDRRLSAELSRCAGKVRSACLEACDRSEQAVAGAVIVVQTFGKSGALCDPCFFFAGADGLHSGIRMPGRRRSLKILI
jgi:hypothetical protein